MESEEVQLFLCRGLRTIERIDCKICVYLGKVGRIDNRPVSRAICAAVDFE